MDSSGHLCAAHPHFHSQMDQSWIENQETVVRQDVRELSGYDRFHTWILIQMRFAEHPWAQFSHELGTKEGQIGCPLHGEIGWEIGPSGGCLVYLKLSL